MIYAFTGPERDLTERELALIRRVIDALPSPTEFVTGAAKGVDTACAEAALSLHPRATHRLCIPDGFRHNRRLVREAPASVVRDYVPGCAKSPMPRNDRMVTLCDVLIGFPETAEEVQRSGTWATIRRGRKRGRRVILHPLDEA